MAWLAKPKAILTANGGLLELADSGDRESADLVLRWLAERFAAVVVDHLFRNLMGDPERECDYWYLDIRGRSYLLMRCTAPEAPPGICLDGPVATADDLALFRAVAASFGAVERDRRPSVRRWWWFW